MRFDFSIPFFHFWLDLLHWEDDWGILLYPVNLVAFGVEIGNGYKGRIWGEGAHLEISAGWQKRPIFEIRARFLKYSYYRGQE